MDFSAWDRDDLLHEHVHAVEGGREITVLTDGMRCAACAWLVDRALRRETGVLDTSANAVTGPIRIAWDPAQAVLSTRLPRIAAGSEEHPSELQSIRSISYAVLCSKKQTPGTNKTIQTQQN